MDNAWIIAFYKETDPVKRLELLKANTGDGESEKDKYRKQLWIARYGKRTPVKDEFMRCLMEMKEEIISNKIKCKKCGNIIESRSTNDYKRCSCGAVAVDGGLNI